ncbi:MAG: bifunctional nuclease family protein [bacterium JZ-2024 1]
MNSERRARVLGVTLSPGTNSMVVLLEEESGDRVLPIWIGEFEGSNIDMALKGIQPPRPFPYDLMVELVTRLGSTVDRVAVTSLKDNTFFAEIGVLRDGKRIVLDSRPSDAIAIAVRSSAPIFVSEEVLEQAAIPRRLLKKILESREEPGESPEEEMSHFKEFISRIRPEEFRSFLEEESGEQGSGPSET